MLRLGTKVKASIKDILITTNKNKKLLPKGKYVALVRRKKNKGTAVVPFNRSKKKGKTKKASTPYNVTEAMIFNKRFYENVFSGGGVRPICSNPIFGKFFKYR